MHNKTETCLTIFQWTKFDIIFQFLGALPPNPHRGSTPGPRWGTSVPPDPLILVLENCNFRSLKVLEKSLNFVLSVCYEPCVMLVLLLLYSLVMGVCRSPVSHLSHTSLYVKRSKLQLKRSQCMGFIMKLHTGCILYWLFH